MNSLILWKHGITELIQIQETSNNITVTKNSKKETHGKMNDSVDVDLECEMIWGNDVIFNTPKKQTESSQYNTPEHNYQEISRFKDTFWFLSPATNSLQNSIEKANKESEFKYNSRQLKEARKDTIETVNHILNNDLVREYPAAAKYVAEIEWKMQETKEDFTKEVISIEWLKIGKDNEFCFPSFKNKTTEQVQKKQGYFWIEDCFVYVMHKHINIILILVKLL